MNSERMKRCGVLIVAAATVWLGCGGSDAAPDSGESAGMGGSGDANGCSGDVVETRLPGPNAPDEVVALCTACDDSCREAGAPCEEYASACDADGEPGVCGACCDGAVGALRCFRIE